MQISFQNVSYKYKTYNKKDTKEAISNINLDINSTGEFICIVGRTGSGKSTLLEHINALKLPTKGLLDVLGYKIKPRFNRLNLKKLRKEIGVVFQFPEYQLFEETVLKDVMFAPLNFGFKKDVARKKALDALSLVNLKESLYNTSPFNLSGGEMRLAAIASVLSYEPSVFLLDEPTRGLDPKKEEEVMEFFYNYHKQTNKTFIVITHDMDLAFKYATRIVSLNDSKILYDGDPIKFFLEEHYNKCMLKRPYLLDLMLYLNDNGYNIPLDIRNYNDLVSFLRSSSCKR